MKMKMVKALLTVAVMLNILVLLTACGNGKEVHSSKQKSKNKVNNDVVALENNEQEEIVEEEQKEVKNIKDITEAEYIEAYTKALENEKNLKDVDGNNYTNLKFQLLDLDMNGIPELIVYGHGTVGGSSDDEIARFYTIGENGKAIVCSALTDENEFSIELLYDNVKDAYDWYKVAGDKIGYFTISYSKEDGFQSDGYLLEQDVYQIGKQLERVSKVENVFSSIEIDETDYKSKLEAFVKEHYIQVKDIIPENAKSEYPKDLSIK